jgi:hypothetical protein
MAEHRKPNDQSAGRRADAALPLGEREGGDTRGKAKALGRRERRNAGLDGPEARAVGDAFKDPRAR